MQAAPCRYLDELCGSITAVFINCYHCTTERNLRRWRMEGERGWNKEEVRQEEVWISNRGECWAGSVKGNIRRLQVNVNIDLINSKLCWLLLTYASFLSPRCPVSGINFSAGSCFGEVVILLSGEITIDSRIHFPLSIIQMWPSLIMHGNAFSTANQVVAVQVCTYVCVYITSVQFPADQSRKRVCDELLSLRSFV